MVYEVMGRRYIMDMLHMCAIAVYVFHMYHTVDIPVRTIVRVCYLYVPLVCRQCFGAEDIQMHTCRLGKVIDVAPSPPLTPTQREGLVKVLIVIGTRSIKMKYCIMFSVSKKLLDIFVAPVACLRLLSLECVIMSGLSVDCVIVIVNLLPEAWTASAVCIVWKGTRRTVESQ